VPEQAPVSTEVDEDPGIHVYVYGEIPPVVFTVIVPLHTPWQSGITTEGWMFIAGGCVIFAPVYVRQLFTSLSSTV
jgi:hypothetical protein